MNEITSQNSNINDENFTIPNAAAITSEIIINPGETITNSTINSGETLIISSGGSSTYITLNGAVQYISLGGVDENGIIYVGSQYVYNGGSAINTSIYANGVQYVSGGNVYGVQVLSDATQYVDDGIVSNVIVGGNQYISNGTVTDVTIVSNATQYVDNGIVSNVIVGGNQYISGGILNTGEVRAGAVQYIYDGTVTDYSVASGAVQYISGGIVTDYSVALGAVQYISGGIVNTGEVRAGAVQYIYGGSVSDIILSGATQYIASGAYVQNVDMNEGAKQYIENAVVTNVTVKNDNGGGLYTSMMVNGYLEISIALYTPSEQYILSGGVLNNVSTQMYRFSDGGTSRYDTGNHMIEGRSFSRFWIGLVDQYVLDGGVINGGYIGGGAQYISSGGVVNNVSIATNPNDFQDIQEYLDGCSLSVGMGQYISAGGLANGTVITQGGAQFLLSGGHANNTQILTGSQVVGGIASNTIVVQGKQDILSGGIAENTSLFGGAMFISADGIANNVTLANGSGYISIYSGGTLNSDLVLASGGYLTIANGGVLGGNVTLNPGGSVTIGVTNGGSVDLIGNNNGGLTISGYTAGVNTSVSTEIKGFSGLGEALSDKVTIDGLQAANVSSVTYPDADHITLQLLDGTSLTLNMVGIKQTGYTLGSDGNGNLTMIVCFLSGTMIKMAKGVCAVEDLQVGGMVLTYDPQTKAKVKKKITWVGKQTAHVNAKLPDDQAGYPIRILKDAFKKNVPNKDLLITPEHCLFIDGYFVPARMLVNGLSIYYDYSITSYDYYHVETEDHSVIWADGMLTESYLNTRNRHSFNKDQKIVKLDSHVKSWAEDAAALLMVERSFVEPIFNNLVKRADKQKLINQNEKNYVLSNDSGLYLLTEDGEEIYQSRVDKDRVIFSLPANTQHVYIVSRKSRPCDVIGPFVDDRRPLGVLVGRVVVLNQYGAYPVAQVFTAR